MCGEDEGQRMSASSKQGRSPRVRGRLILKTGGWRIPGSIPACAGKTPGLLEMAERGQVDPRVCGEDRIMLDAILRAAGRSPRVRGRRYAVAIFAMSSRSIPACAGKTRRALSIVRRIKVDPRVCGEDKFTRSFTRTFTGRSPRVRGRPDPAGHALGRHGSIPACAGKTFEALTTEKVKEVDPRVCGEDRSDPDRPRPGWGRSPRVRGRPVQAQLWNIDGRSIPACAGKTCQNLNEPRATTVDPRVCGEDLASVQALTISPGRSPRVRGRPVHREGTESRARSIPACAGKTWLPLTV